MPQRRNRQTSKPRRLFIAEALERRRLLTTMVGGGYFVNDPTDRTLDTPIAIEYGPFLDTGGHLFRVQVAGNVQAEFMGYGFDPTTLTIGPVDLGGGIDLFQIYVAQGDINGYITVTAIDPTTGAETPFNAPFPFNVNFANPPPGPPPTVAAGAGSLTLGAFAVGPTTQRPAAPGTDPIIKENIGGIGFGLRPAGLDDLPEDPNNDWSAGLFLAPGQSLGKFLFGGEVFGKVFIPGSMKLFYAGWLLTGDARGADEAFGTPLDNGQPVELDFTDFGNPVPRSNFFVGGDIENLLSWGPFGWDGVFTNGDLLLPRYLSGIDITVQGRVGQVMSIEGSAATIDVFNTSSIVREATIQEEVEGLNAVDRLGNFFDPADGHGLDFERGFLTDFLSGADANPFDNNDFDTAQLLGAFTTPSGPDTIQIRGHIDTLPTPDVDPLDFYAVGLLAGQTISVQLQSGALLDGEVLGPGIAYLGVLDPDGRLIATDYSNTRNPALVYNQPFQFTADRPGAYRFVVGTRGDVDFTGDPNTLGPNDYYLFINNVTTVPSNIPFAINGPLTMGGYVSRGTIIDVVSGAETVNVRDGDLGAIEAADYHLTISKLLTAPLPVPGPQPDSLIRTYSVSVLNGNLRSFDVGDMGVGVATGSITFDTGPDINIPLGNLGLIRSRVDQLQFNPSAQNDERVWAIKGDIQIVDAATLLEAGVVNGGRIGTIRAATIGWALQSTVITADADNAGFDGTVDMIYATDQINGPQLSHGPGGNFRYMVAPAIFNDPLFSVGNQQRVTHDFFEPAVFTDDSGSQITLTPIGPSVINTAFDPTDPDTGPQILGPRLTTMTYGVRSGGVIVVDVQSIGPNGIANAGLEITGKAFAGGGSAEVSRVEISGETAAPTIITNIINRRTGVQLPIAQTLDQQLTLDINGSAIVDVFYVGVTRASNGATNPVDIESSQVLTLGNVTRIANYTGGELVTIHAANAGQIFSRATIGLAKTLSGAAVNIRETLAIGSAYPGTPREAMPINPASASPRAANPLGGVFPFAPLPVTGEPQPYILTAGTQTYGVAINGHIVEVRAGQGLGNIVANGTVGDLVANSDRQDTANVFEGINGNVWAFGANGRFLNIQIGEGVASSGSGSVSLAGIYADSQIGSLVNQGAGSDIHGDLVSGGTIGPITLNNGAIIDSDVLILSNGSDPGAIPFFSASRENTPIGFLIPSAVPVFQTNLTFDIGPITIAGSQGGIIGSFFQARSVGPFDVKGFGIISTRIEGPFDGTIGVITTNGYGLRDGLIGGGAFIRGINANGNGSDLSTFAITPSVRLSEVLATDPVFHVSFDPFSGKALTSQLDLHAQLGTSASTPVIPGVTDTGVVEDTTVSSQRDMVSLTAQTIRGKIVTLTNSPQDPNSPASPNFLMQLSIANSIGTIKTRGIVNGLRVITGRIKKFEPAADVLSLNMTVSGPINNVRIKGSLANNSSISAIGPNGDIGVIQIFGDLVGDVRATGRIGTIIVGGNVTGDLQVDGLSRPGSTALNKLQIGGLFLNGTVNVNGNVNSIRTFGGFGTAGDTLNIAGSLNEIKIGYGTLGIMNANLTVAFNINKMIVNGQVDGAINVGTDFKLLQINAGGPVDVLNGGLTVGGDLKKLDVRGGNVGSNVTVTGNVTDFKITEGTFNAGDTLRSVNGSIKNVIIVAGNEFGSIFAQAGTIGTIRVDGNLGNGVDPLTIATNALNTMSIGGSILNAVTVDVNGPIGTLFVGGNFEAGAVIRAQSLANNQIQGQTLGSLIIG